MAKMFYTLEEAASLLGVSEDEVRQMLENDLQPGNGIAGGPDTVKGSDGQIRYAAKERIGRKGESQCFTSSAPSMSPLEPSSLIKLQGSRVQGAYPMGARCTSPVVN